MKGTIEIREPEVKGTPEAHPPAPSAEELQRLLQSSAPARPMFSDSLLQYQGQRRRQTLATTLSFIFQCLIVGLLLLLPLCFTQELPKSQLLTFLVAPPPPPPPPPPAAAQAVKIMKQVQSDLLSSGQLRTPSRIPQKVEMIKEEEAPPPMPSTGGVVGGVPGGIPGGQLGGVIGGIVNSTSNTYIPKLQPVIPERVRVSQGVTSGLLIHKVQPVYPPIAKAARVQGEVQLKAIISKEGTIEDLQLVSGHPMLVPPAIEAVKQWRYRPYLLNGQPVEVETTITVIFTLSG